MVLLIEYARREEIDVVVLATPGRTGIKHALIGSVAERVVQMAPCPVLTVKHPARVRVAPGLPIAAAPSPPTTKRNTWQTADMLTTLGRIATSICPNKMQLPEFGSWGKVRRGEMRTGIAIGITGIIIMAMPAFAVSVSGRSTTSVYAFESTAPDGSSVRNTRGYESVRLNVGAIGVPQLSFHTYLHGTTDLTEEADSDPRLRIYRAHLTWKQSGQRVQAGRQRVLAGVGYGSIDGVRGDLEHHGLRLTAYAGSLVPLDRSTHLNSLEDAHLVGLRLSSDRLLSNTSIAVSFADRERNREETTAGSTTLTERVAARRLVGLDVARSTEGGHRLQGRVDYDLLDDELRRSDVSGTYQHSGNLSVQAEWLWRKPSIYENALFSFFDVGDFQEFGGRINYQVSDDVTLSGHVATVLYDGDDSQRVGLTAVLDQRHSIGYYRSMGYAGAYDGIVGNLQYALTPKLALRGQLDLAAYERYEGVDDRDELVTAVVGLGFRPDRMTLLDLQLQGLRNPSDSTDTRVFARVSRRFFKGGF